MGWGLSRHLIPGGRKDAEYTTRPSSGEMMLPNPNTVAQIECPPLGKKEKNCLNGD